VLGSWQQRVTSLRVITRDDVLAAVSALRGEDAHHLMVALRSVFRALRQERMVFANPCAGISVTRSEALPAALPSDRLAGLIECAGSPLARLAVALVSVHAVQPGELRRLTMADLDLPRARITMRLRQDRILDEARQTADPVRLMRLFGVSDTTAMKYVYTAHPDRQSVPGR
jgi:site-specific recombinase XerC